MDKDKTTIQEIASVLTGKRGLTAQEADRFVSVMFDIVKEMLRQESVVKIKGLGTFKTVGVEARESINIRSGERFMIDGHEKISFTPDTDMKEMVNKPFSQFETVILGEGFDLEKELSTYQEPDTQEPDIQEPDIQEPDIQEPTSIPSPWEGELVTSSTEDNNTTVTENADSSTEDNNTTVTENADSSTEDITEEDVTPTENVPCPVADDNRTNNLSPLLSEEDGDENSGHRILPWLLWTALTLLIGAGAYTLGYWQGQGTTTVAQQSPPSTQKEGGKEPFTPPSETIASSRSNLPKEAIKEPDRASEEPFTPPSEAIDSSRSNLQEEVIDYGQKDVRVRTGAYRIIGTDRVVTARKGDNLSRVSRRELGEGMVCYVAVYNNMKDDEPLAEGQQIKIPKLKWKLKTRK